MGGCPGVTAQITVTSFFRRFRPLRLGLAAAPIGVPMLEPHPRLTMPQGPSPGTNEPQTFHNSLSTIHRTTDPEKLQYFQHEALLELSFRLRQPGTHASPHLHDFTDGELLQIMDEISKAIMDVLSRVQAAHHEARWANRHSDRGTEILFTFILAICMTH